MRCYHVNPPPTPLTNNNDNRDMKVIIEKDSACCEHDKPHPKAFRDKVPYWEIRTVSIDGFDKKFAGHEGKWKSKGTNHKEIPRPEGAQSGDEVWCTRKLDDREVWCVTVGSVEKFIREVKNATFSVSEENEGMIFVRV